jgi:Transposase, Mutator family
LLPDGPVPDGRTVLTNPDATGIEAVMGHRAHLAPFIPVTNLLERSLGEVKRRTKVIGRFPGETSCLTLVWAVLDLLITHQTNGIHFNALDRQRLKRARYQGNEQTIPEEVTAA